MTILDKFNVFGRKIFKNITINVIKPKPLNEIQRKYIWGYIAIAFNRVDTERLKEVGPDRLCAEWLIKNGGAIRIGNAINRPLKDYNTLPPEYFRFRIKVVDATGSSIMKIGLEHFRGCDYINTVIFHKCTYLEADGLVGLIHLKKSLKVLQVSACDHISDTGLMVIGELSNLEFLKIYEMRYVKNMAKVKQYLMTKLPNCYMIIY